MLPTAQPPPFPNWAQAPIVSLTFLFSCVMIKSAKQTISNTSHGEVNPQIVFKVTLLIAKKHALCICELVLTNHGEVTMLLDCQTYDISVLVLKNAKYFIVVSCIVLSFLYLCCYPCCEHISSKQRLKKQLGSN